MKIINIIFCILIISSNSKNENPLLKGKINFAIAKVQTIVITFMDLKGECELDYLMYGGKYQCENIEYLRKMVYEVILRKAVTLMTEDLDLHLVDIEQVNNTMRNLVTQKREDYIKFLSKTGFTQEEVRYIIWERFNTNSYLILRFGQDFSDQSEEFKNWKKEIYKKLDIRNYWDYAQELIKKLIEVDSK